MIPSIIKVGGLYYDVKTTDDPLILNTRQCKGIIDYEHQTIKLAGDSVHSVQGREQTFFHELVHALRHSRGLDWGENDELYTDEIGIALHAFFIDNGISFGEVMTLAKTKTTMKQYEKSAADKNIDKKMNLKEGSKKDDAQDKKGLAAMNKSKKK